MIFLIFAWTPRGSWCILHHRHRHNNPLPLSDLHGKNLYQRLVWKVPSNLRPCRHTLPLNDAPINVALGVRIRRRTSLFYIDVRRHSSTLLQGFNCHCMCSQTVSKLRFAIYDALNARTCTWHGKHRENAKLLTAPVGTLCALKFDINFDAKWYNWETERVNVNKCEVLSN